MCTFSISGSDCTNRLHQFQDSPCRSINYRNDGVVLDHSYRATQRTLTLVPRNSRQDHFLKLRLKNESSWSITFLIGAPLDYVHQWYTTEQPPDFFRVRWLKLFLWFKDSSYHTLSSFFLRVKTCVSFDTRNSVSCLTIHPVVDIYHSIIKQCPVTAIILLGVEESDDLWQKRFSLAFGSASLSLKKKECKLFF